MILSTPELKRRLDERPVEGKTFDPLIITPLPRDISSLNDIEQFENSAVDLRLGTWFEVPRVTAMSHLDILDESTRDDAPQARQTKTVYRPFGGEFFLPPRHFVLASTLEWVRLPADLSGTVTGKSSWGRRGLIIATAITVHPHFTGCLTLELANVGEVTIALQPGVRICQLELQQLTSPPSPRPDQSIFAGHRRPVLAPIRLDSRAKALLKSD